MANILKKLVAGISTVAILATMAVPVALAADGDELETWDYTAAGAAADWSKQNDNITQTIDDDALYITSSRNGAARWASKSFSTAITTSSIIEYDIQLTCVGDTSTYLYLGASASNHLVSLEFPKYGASVKVNGGAAATMDSPGSNKTPWMHVKHTFDFVRNQIETEITYKDGGNQIYSGTTGYATANATESISEMRLVLYHNTNNFRISSLTAAEHEIVLTDAEKVEVIKDTLNVDTTQRCLSTSTVDNKTIYTVMKDIELPTSDEATSIIWALAQRPIDDATASWTTTSFATIEENKLVLDATDESENYYVKATATISVNEESDTKDFWFIVKPFINNKFPGSIEIWDYEFDDKDWTLNNASATTLSQAITDSGDTLLITNNNTSNTYTAYKNFANPSAESATVSYDMRFYCRGEGTTTLYLGAGTTDCLFKMVLPREGKSATINGGDTATITGASDYYTPWLHVDNTFNFVTNTVKTVIKNAEGTELYSGTSAYASTLTESISRFTIDLGKYNNVAIKDVVVYPYEVTDQEIVDYSKGILDITDLTKTDDVYTATGDFQIPETPAGTTVSWKAMQKAKSGGDWEDSQFIAVSGSTAVIKPTEDINDYDVKLVATITSGNVTDTKEFAISLPNPMDEINGILNNNFNIVNTTDTDAESKVITFDLNGTDMLKRDLALPLSVKSYKNTTIAWTSSDVEHIAIDKDGVATLMTSDLSEHEVKLTAVITYKKNDVTYSSDPHEFTVKMGFEETDAKSDDATMGKYRVRYDAAYEANFDIPTSTTSDISLPKSGHFGSTFTWTSNALGVISNAGKVTRQSTTKTVDLTADIISGSASAKASFKVEVSGNGSSSSSSSGGGGGGGGGTASSTGTINRGTTSGAISTPTSSAAAPGANISAADNVARLQEEALASNDLFTDIPQAAWARDAINALARAGIINGKTDTEFYPNDTVTRAEFAKMLMGAFGLVSDAYTTSSFYDVPVDAWYFPYVESAYNLSVIQGTGNGRFEPDALITRQDMAVMVARAALIAGKVFADERAMISFADNDSIAYYATEAVEQLVKAGMMNGMSDTEFAPTANATRAQAAQILYNIIG